MPISLNGRRALRGVQLHSRHPCPRPPIAVSAMNEGRLVFQEEIIRIAQLVKSGRGEIYNAEVDVLDARVFEELQGRCVVGRLVEADDAVDPLASQELHGRWSIQGQQPILRCG